MKKEGTFCNLGKIPKGVNAISVGEEYWLGKREVVAGVYCTIKTWKKNP